MYVNEFGASAINIMLYCFHEAPDWGTELRERHRLYLDIMRLAERLEVEFAFPTQTIHLASDQAGAPPGVAPPRSGVGRFPDPDQIARSRPAQPQARKSPVPSDREAAARFGREQATALASAQPGSDSDKPPTVTFD